MPLKTYQDPLPELNLTSMIDVVFLLIIFFMVGTKFAEMEKTVAVDVPRVAQFGSDAPSGQRHIVNVFQDGSLSFDDERLELNQLRDRLAAALANDPALKVIVRGDRSGEFQHVATVLTTCRAVGVHDLGIGVQPGSDAESGQDGSGGWRR